MFINARDNETMPVMNDEVPDEGDYDAGRGRGEFDNITPEDFIHGGGSGHGNPPGWLGPDALLFAGTGRYQPGPPPNAHRIRGDRAGAHR